jgi:hypothetical protein
MVNIFEHSIFYLLQDLYIYIYVYMYVLYIIFCCPGFIVILGPYGTIFGRGRAGFVSQIGRSWPPVSWRTCEIGQRGISILYGDYSGVG